MAQTINPAVCGGRKNTVLVGAVFAGSVTLGALVVGMVVSAASMVVDSDWRVWAVLSCLLVLTGASVGLPFRFPYRQAQVPEWIRETLGPKTVAAIFGFMLGLGFATLYVSPLHLVFLSLLFLSSTPQQVILMTVAFALGKSVPVFATLGAHSLEEINDQFSCSLRPQHLKVIRERLALAVPLFLFVSVFLQKEVWVRG